MYSRCYAIGESRQWIGENAYNSGTVESGVFCWVRPETI
jgi:hypothetical protein